MYDMELWRLQTFISCPSEEMWSRILLLHIFVRTLAFQSDLPLASSFFTPQYCCSLNSDDKINPDLPLTSNRAHAGVLVFWKKLHDPFVTIYDVNSSRFLVLLLNHPNLPTTIHITIYLLTLCSPLYQWRSSCYWKGKGRGENQKPVLDTPLRSSLSAPQPPPQATRPSPLPMQDPHTSYLEIFWNKYK